MAHSGKCLCGKVTLKTNSLDNNMGSCHCSFCRKWSAGPFLSSACADLKIEGVEHLGIFESSAWAQRGFCKNCGSSLFYQLKNTESYYVNSEIFEKSDFFFDHQVFIDEKPSYYEFANQTKNMTGAELFAAFAPKE